MRIEQAAKLITNSKYTVALTGAGISTPSGIPDFRSSENGLWRTHNPMEVASLSAFRVRPEKFFEWFRPLTKLILEASPNRAHITLARLEEMGFLKSIITQNIDGLHQKAGSQNVFEVHGTIYSLTCGNCYNQYQSILFMKPYIENGTIPRCPSCGRILKPDAILFEEQLPKNTWLQVEKEVLKSDLMIVVGSSLEVVPVASLPYQVVNQGAKIIIINNQETYIDTRAEVVINQDVAIALPQILELL